MDSLASFQLAGTLHDMILEIATRDQIGGYVAKIEAAAGKALSNWDVSANPINMLRRMKFEPMGYHPIDGRPLNLIEQVNQTFTFLVALRAVEWLFGKHPDIGGFRVSAGAHAALPLDIMSIKPDIVGAETFAAVAPSNNDKLKSDLRKLQRFPSMRFRYAFFYAPGFSAGRIERLDREFGGIEVHCIDITASGPGRI